MFHPRRIAGKRGGLLPPTALLQNIHAPVPIDVAGADAMGEALVLAIGWLG